MRNIETYQIRQIARNNPRQLFAIFLLAVLILGFFLVTLQQIGTPPSYQSYLALGLLVALYPVIGIMARTMQLDEFQTAGHRVGRAFGGMAIATSLISGGAFITLSGEIFNNGLNGLLWISALVLGLAVASMVVAPAIATNRASTLPQFLTTKGELEGPTGVATSSLRLSSLIILVLCSLLLIVGQLGLTQLVATAFFGISPRIAVVCGLLAVLFCLLLGGMRALTWVRVSLYIVVAAAFLVPVAWISYSLTSNPIPYFSYGAGAVEVISSFQQELTNQGVAVSGIFGSFATNSADLTVAEIITWILCIAAGTAAMPHMLQHFATTNSPANARSSGSWAMIFLTIVLCAAPAYAAYITLEIYNAMVGLPLRELQEQAPWLFSLGLYDEKALVSICGAQAVDFATIVAACDGGESHQLIPADININSAIIMLAAGNIADFPPIISTLIAVGTFAALFSTIDGLLLVIANCIARDGYHYFLRPHAPRVTVLFMSRFFLAAATALAGYATLTYDFSATLLVILAFSLAAAGLFPALMVKSLGANPRHAALLFGMISGAMSAVIAAYLAFWGMDMKWHSGDEILLNPLIQNTPSDITTLMQSGCIGMLVGFATIMAISFTLNIFSKRMSDA